MCLFTYGNKLIAKEDIVCYKVMYKSFFGARSYFANFRYFYFYKYKCKIVLNRDLNSELYGIGSGFHSYQTLSEAVECGIKNTKIYECIIPKGATYFCGDSKLQRTYRSSYVTYFLNEAAQYVSDQIIIKKIVK